MKYHLLTGATGLLGRYLLRDLTLAEVPVAVVVRRSRFESAAQRIETVMAHWEQQLGHALVRPIVLEGDITSPLVGLPQRDLDWLSAHCETVIHSAASLTFYAEEADGEPWRSNVEGTRNVLDLCRIAKIRKYHHVSTAYVCGQRRGRILETELNVGQELGNDYEQTKILAEQEVLACDLFDVVTVHRPSIIVGDAQTGYTTSFHGFYTPLRLVHAAVTSVPWDVILQSDWLGGLQLEGCERKNLVAVDWVSAAMTELITHPEHHGRTYHLTNPHPTTVADMLEAIGTALGALVESGAVKPAGKTPPEEMVESFREQMKIYQSYWSDDPEFDSSQTEAALAHLPCPEITGEVMDRLVRYAIDANFGWPREASAAARFDIERHLQPWLAAAEQRPVDAADAADAAEHPVSLRVSGSGGGQWHLLLGDGRLVAAGAGLRNGDGPTCYLTSETFSQLARGELNWQRAIDTGRLVVSGARANTYDLPGVFRDLVANS